MTIRSRGKLTFEELRRMEAELRSQGYQPVDDRSQGIQRFEYGTSKDRAPGQPAPATQVFSICWRT